MYEVIVYNKDGVVVETKMFNITEEAHEYADGFSINYYVEINRARSNEKLIPVSSMDDYFFGTLDEE